MAVKRRIVWFSDEDWATLQQVARDRGDSISAVLRDFWKVAADPAVRVAEMAATIPSSSLAIQQAERDRILRGVNRKGAKE